MVWPDLLTGVPLADYDPGAVQAAAARVRDHCGWLIAPSVTETVTFTAPRSGVLFLPSLRVTAVSVLTVGGTASTWFRWSSTGRVELLGYRHGTDLDVVVTYTHGYDVCPESVRATVAKLASVGLVPQASVKSETDTKGPFTTAVTYFDGGNDLAGVDAYRLPVVA